MSIPIPLAAPKPKPFIQRAELHLAGKLAEWKAHWIGTPAEPFALQYAEREGWVMPGAEGLDSVTALSLFPNCSIVDLKELDRRIKAGTMTEAAATQTVARAAKSDLAEAEAGINRLRFPDVAAIAASKRTVVAAPEPPATPPVLFRSDFAPKPSVCVSPAATGQGSNTSDPCRLTTGAPEHVPTLATEPPPLQGKGTDAPVAPSAPEPPPTPPPPPKAAGTAAQEALGPLVGQPEGLGSAMHRCHRVQIGGIECYTFNRDHLEALQSAQVSRLTLKVAVEQGDFGNKIISIAVTNPTP